MGKAMTKMLNSETKVKLSKCYRKGLVRGIDALFF